MWRLMRQVEERLMQLTVLQSRVYKYKELEKRVYAISPCPPQPGLIQIHSNVISVEIDRHDLIVQTERLEDIEDIIKILNAACVR